MMSYQTSFGQMNFWISATQKFSMSSPTPVATNLPGTPGFFPAVANGAYDQNGNLLFFVSGDGVYDKYGNFVKSLFRSYTSDCSNKYYKMNAEISIVPIPGYCNQFYVIYGMSNPIGASVLLWVEINCTSGIPVITGQDAPQSVCTGGNKAAFGPISYNTPLIPFAVSKISSGTGFSAKRYLYSLNKYDGINRSEILSNTITPAVTIATLTQLSLSSGDFRSIEAELSWGSNYFAWISRNTSSSTNVHIIELDPVLGDYKPNTLRNYSVADPTGIEFNNSLTNPILYVSGSAGVTKILTSNQTQTIIPTGTFDLSQSLLEYGKNNKIYGISPTSSGTSLVGISTISNSITSISSGSIPVYQDNTGMYLNIYTLPDQVDGENYNYLDGYPAVSINSFTLNGTIPPGDCELYGFKTFCQNTPISFNATYSGGTPSEYKLDIQATGGDPCSIITGTGKINYSSNWVSGTLSANLDLRFLSDGNGINLGNTAAGSFQVTYSIKNACGYISTYSKIIFIASTLAPVLNLQLYDKTNTQNYLNPSQNINAAISVGTASLGFRISNSTGTINSLSVIIDEVNSTGVFVKNIYNRTTTVTGVSSLTYVNLNNYCMPASVWGINPGFGSCTAGSAGYTGFFSYTNGQFSNLKKYKLTVTVSNQCGSSTNWSYLYVNSIGNKGGNSNEFSLLNDNPSSVRIFPNPVENKLTLEINTEIEDMYSFSITDMFGKKVMEVEKLIKSSEGIQTYDFDIADLPSGIYTYLIQSKTENYSGVFTKL